MQEKHRDMTEADAEALIRDINTAFPQLVHVKPMRDFSSRYDPAGVWIVDVSHACLSGGERFFYVPSEVGYVDPPGYSSFVHGGFLHWLEERGWYVETYDYGSYMVVPVASVPKWPTTPPANPLQSCEVPF